MIQIRRRWPILATTVATLVYGFNHFQIAGIEHLRLEPRPPAASQVGFPLGYELGVDLTQFGVQAAPALGLQPGLPTAASLPSQWKDRLSVGEKLAVWEGQLAAQDSSPSPEMASGDSRPAASFPVSSPIPVPNEFERPALDQSKSKKLGNPADLSRSTLAAMGANAVSNSEASRERSRAARTIRIASFNVESLGPAKLAKSNVIETLVAILRQYDVVALQEIQSSRDDLLPMIVDRLNQSGRTFDYMIGPRLGRVAPHKQFAFVFDTERLESDRFQLYTVDDPEDLIHYDPLVAWFRCRQVSPTEAFTFSLVNVLIDPDLVDNERAVLPSLIEAIQRDGRGEDDWIIVGDMAGGISQLTAVDQETVRFAVREIPTNVSGTQTLDTIFFSARATSEFTGRAGAFDFLRKYNLSIERALEVSSHLPVWAEFSVVEGAEPGRTAPPDPRSVY